MIKLKVTIRKNGQQITSYRDSRGRRVRTSNGPVNWAQARSLMSLGLYAIDLQREQAAAGLGSDGSPMPPLKVGKLAFKARVNGKATFMRKTLRNLYGPGIGGHMLDDIRVNYVDDRMVKWAITNRLGQIKAKANEKKAEWWGLSPESQKKLILRMGELFNTDVADQLFHLGLAAAGAVATKFNRIVAAARRAA